MRGIPPLSKHWHVFVGFLHLVFYWYYFIIWCAFCVISLSLYLHLNVVPRCTDVASSNCGSGKVKKINAKQIMCTTAACHATNCCTDRLCPATHATILWEPTLLILLTLSHISTQNQKQFTFVHCTPSEFCVFAMCITLMHRRSFLVIWSKFKYEQTTFSTINTSVDRDKEANVFTQADCTRWT